LDRRFYDEYARIQGQHWWFRGRRRVVGALLDASLDRGGARPRILDVGCGTGAMLPLLAEYGETRGVDSEPAAVDYCRTQGERVELASAVELPFADESFELVTMLDIVEHVDDEAGALSEAARVLVPDGLALVTVPAYQWMWGAQDEISHHRRRYTRARLRAALAGADLRTLRAGYFNTILFPPIAAVRLARRLRDHPATGSDVELTRPGRLNELLTRVFGLEATLVRRADPPFGVSAFAVARRATGGST
jgi:SAM-dependent methyltransferase